MFIYNSNGMESSIAFRVIIFYSMFNYISRVFKKTVFFHTAGSIDQQVLKSLNLDIWLRNQMLGFW